MIQQFSVTEVLQPYFNVKGTIPQQRIAGGVIRGNEVHKFCTAKALKEWVPKPILYEGYCDSFLWWLNNCVEEVLLVEQRLEDPILGFYGHPDLIAKIKGNRYPNIIDLKTPSTKNKLWAIQISTYHHLATKNGYPILDVGGSLRLKENGDPPKFDGYNFQYVDFAAFVSALNVCRYLNG